MSTYYLEPDASYTTDGLEIADLDVSEDIPLCHEDKDFYHEDYGNIIRND